MLCFANVETGVPHKPNRVAVEMTVMFVVMGEAVEGLIGVAEPIKATTPRAIEALRTDGLPCRLGPERRRGDGGGPIFGAMLKRL